MVQVIGVPDAVYGEELCAWIKLKAGRLRDGRGDKRPLPGPDRALVHPLLPMTATGKLQLADRRAALISSAAFGASGGAPIPWRRG